MKVPLLYNIGMDLKSQIIGLEGDQYYKKERRETMANIQYAGPEGPTLEELLLKLIRTAQLR